MVTKTQSKTGSGSDIDDPKTVEMEAGLVERNILKIAGIIVLIGFVFILVAPIVFTHLPSVVDLTQVGQIGDTIGGTTAPIVGLNGAILVFLSLFAQIKANRLVLVEFLRERVRYNNERKERENDREEELKRYDRERADFTERLRIDSGNEKIRQQNDLFTKLLDVVRMYDESLRHLEHRESKGISAIAKAVQAADTGMIIHNFNVITTIANGAIACYQTALEFGLVPYQRLMIATQLMIVSTKIYGPIEDHRHGQDLSGPNLKSLHQDLLAFRILLTDVVAKTGIKSEPI